jgi:Ca2+:H+ antiporter
VTVTETHPTQTGPRGVLSRSDLILIAASVILTVASAAAKGAGAVAPFVISALALALLAALVGRCVDQLAERLGPGGTGVLQSALGNLPELFVCVFALRQGLTDVVTAALIGSILGNLLLVLGLAFVVGGRRHGMLRFSELRARMVMSLMILSVAAMFVPSLAHYVGAAAGSHEVALSRVTAVVLLLVFVLSVPASVRREEAEGGGVAAVAAEPSEQRWPLALAVGVLAITGILAAYVSDLFVNALQPAMTTLHINQVFAGLVIVAIAGNAVENVVGIQLAWQQKADHALSVILNSPLQIALVLAPVLVLISPLIGGPSFTLVFSPMLMASVGISVGAVAFLTFDGLSDWLEGATMVGLYALIAAAFWWG